MCKCKCKSCGHDQECDHECCNDHMKEHEGKMKCEHCGREVEMVCEECGGEMECVGVETTEDMPDMDSE